MGNNISRISKDYDARYIEGKIYTITCEDGAVYVGSTYKTLKERLQRHTNDERCSMYKYIHNNYDGDWSKCKINLYENYPCNSKEELSVREGEITRLIGTINHRIAGRSHKEYINDNKDYFDKYHQEYRDNNKEIIAERHKNYYEKNKEILAEKNKKWREENIEKIKQYKNNKRDVINESYRKANIKIECDCGCIIGKYQLKRHQTSQRHKDLMEKQISAILSFLESIQECL